MTKLPESEQSDSAGDENQQQLQNLDANAALLDADKLQLTQDEFSVAQALGGWRGFIESVIPGTVFVVAFVIWGGFKIPIIAAVSALLTLIIIRLAQKGSLQQALSGAFGVALGAFWAWRNQEADAYFVPGFWTSGISAAVLLISVLVNWPLVGVITGVLIAKGQAWWKDVRRNLNRMRLATLILFAMFSARLLVQIPLYLADKTVALGTARLIMGLPLFAITLWAIWWLVRPLVPASTPPDQLPQEQ